MTRRRLLSVALLVGLIALWAFRERIFPPESISGPAASVRDGDTMVLGSQTIRIAGIDAPEYRQTCRTAAGAQWPCGRAARAQLEALVLSGPVQCTVEARDRFQRPVAQCGNATTPDIGAAMVRAGFATSTSPRGEARYAAEQDAARRARRGLWQGPFQSASEWRADHPRGTSE